MDFEASPEIRRLGAYRIESLLGRGGMGEVFLAWDERLRRRVAIKRIRADRLAPDQDAYRRRFRREACAAAKLNHPAIVQIHDILEEDDGDAIVMEHVAGADLRELLRDGAVAPRRALTIARQIAEGLAEAHSEGLVHRGLKPENVRLSEDGSQAKILDFGLVRVLRNDEDVLDDSSDVAAYAVSPEQASGHSVDHRADLFALGGVLYELLSGRAPFHGENRLDALRRINSEGPESLAELCPELPRPSIDLVESLLEKDPAQRPQNAKLVVRAIEDLLGEVNDAPATVKSRHGLITDFDEDATASGVGEVSAAAGESVVRVLVLTDLVDSVKTVDELGDARAAELFARHDRATRDLLARYGGVEIDKSDGFLTLFQRPGDAICFALAYHQALPRLSRSAGASLAARVGVHLGEIFLRANSAQDIARGAKRLEVEGLAKLLAARVMGLAQGRQTLLTRGAFDLARRAAMLGELADPQLRWLAHGEYSLKGIDEDVEIYEVGLEDVAPLAAPPDGEKARRAVSFSDEITLGRRPAAGQEIVRRPKWVLKERLGEGGFGEVWLAEHVSGERRVFKFCFEADRLRALKREVTLFRLMKDALGHRDDIARVLDWNFDEAPFFLEAEYTEGGDLKTWSESQGGLDEIPTETRLEIAAQIADALAAAHSVGVLHKDVKPENVLVDEDSEGRPRVRLTDFGVGRLIDESLLAGRAFTVTGFTEDLGDSSSGTRLYMAPELLLGDPASAQADVYSLGVLIYQLATGSFENALAPGWRRTIDDELLCEDLAAFVDGTPARRPASAAIVAERLRSLEARRAEREARRREAESAEELRRTHERILRRRKILVGVAAGGVAVAFLVSIFAVQAEFARRDADAARDDAEQARAVAQERREQAEDLIGFMVGDLSEKLEPVGRLDVLEDVGEKALSYYAEIAEEEAPPETLGRRAEVLRRIGRVRFFQGDLDAAQEAFQGSLDLLNRQVDQTSAPSVALRAGLADTRFWFGYVAWMRHDHPAALEAYEGHRAIYATLAAEDPDDADLRLEWAYGHMNVGDVRAVLGQTRRALRDHLAGLALIEELSARDPSNLTLLGEVSEAHRRAGASKAWLGDQEGAFQHYQADLSLTEGLLRRDPENTEHQYRLAVTYSFLLFVSDHFGDGERALDYAVRASELMEELTARDQDNMEWRRSSAMGRLNEARQWALARRFDEALRRYRDAEAVAREGMRREPDNGEWAKALASIRIWTGRTLLETGDVEGARRQARAGLQILESRDSDEASVQPSIDASRGYSLLAAVLTEQGDPAGAQVARDEALGKIAPLARGSHDADLLRRWTETLIDLRRSNEARDAAEKMAERGTLPSELLGMMEESGLFTADELARWGARKEMEL